MSREGVGYNESMDFSLDTIQIVVIGLASILISITMHEAMHAFTAQWLGDDTAYLSGRLTLNPLAHIDPFTTVLLPLLLLLSGLPPLGAAKPVPFNPARLKYDEYGAALVAVAGPLTNLGLALISGLWLRFVVGYDAGLLSDSMAIFFSVNLSFFVFNLIPWPPLDGSRVLYAFMPEAGQKFMRQIESFGLMGFFVFFIVLFPFISTIITDIIIFFAEVILGTNVV